MSIDSNLAGWDEEVDVVVAGTGAAGLAAAITASDEGACVVVLESAELIGGTTAISGGQPWVPCNAHMDEVGVPDSREDALTYLDGLIQGREPNRDRLEYFVEHGHEALAYLEATTPLGLRVCRTFSDYFADRPGGKPNGRSLDVVPYGAREALGSWDEKVRRSPQIPSMTLDEMAGATESANPKDASSIAAGTGELSTDLMERVAERDALGVRTGGGALVAALLRGALDRGIEPRTGVRVSRLVVEAGEVVGVEVETDGRTQRIQARRGVVLASGGFDWNRDLVRAFIGVPKIWPISPPSLQGDGLVMGLEVGAAVANMTVTWACPVISDGTATYDGAPMHMLNTPRQEPGVIAVNSRGERFVNEAVAYMQMPLAFRTFDATDLGWPNASPAWLVFDSTVRERVVAGDFAPGSPTPEWVVEADTVEQLAERIGVPAEALSRTVQRWNSQVEAGKDEDFGRASVWFEGWTSGGPNPAMLAPVASGPFFALRFYDGALGTAGGLQTDKHGCVVAMRGGVIPGLYAAGNAAASVFGPAYPGGGATLGQGLAFGHFAGRHAGRRPAETASERAGAAMA